MFNTDYMLSQKATTRHLRRHSKSDNNSRFRHMEEVTTQGLLFWQTHSIYLYGKTHAFSRAVS